MINWSNRVEKISERFSVHDAIYLPKWDRLAVATDNFTEDSQIGLIALFQKMDCVRDLLGVPIIVHCAFRSTKYNFLVNGAQDSAHIARKILVDGKKYFIAAVDFHPLLDCPTQGDKCDKARKKIEPELESLSLRMEDNPKNSPWIHLDSRPVPNGGSRIFKL